MFQILDQQANLVGEDPGLETKDLLELYRLMVLSRRFDRRAVALQRQGRLGTYAMLEGQEAAQVGSAYALGPEDWVYPSYREHAVQIARGMPLAVILSYWRGLPNAEWDPHRYRMAVITVPIGSHLPHAVGHAYGARLQGRPVVTAPYFGDGATSENDFHSGLNFAGVWRTPTVFVCQNNAYAISVPLKRQTASETLAEKAAAYGVNGMRVDGNDVLAMYVATCEAVSRAREGEGPSLIEAVTYRVGPHATADDPRRYRDQEEEAEWRQRDPLLRFRRYLEGKELWSDEAERELQAEIGEALDRAVEDLEARQLPPREDAIRHVYHRIPPLLAEQLQAAQRSAGEAPVELGADELWPDLSDALPEGATRRWNMAEAINAALRQAMERRPETVVLGEDVGISGGVFRITEGLLESYGAERVIDTPLNESGIIGAAIGMAVAGARPVAEIQFDGFVYPGFDQIASHLGRMRFRTRGHLSLPVVVRFPNGAGIRAHEHHCDSPEALFVQLPGLVVVMPSTPTDAKGLLAAALEGDDPVIFMEPKVLYRAGREEVPECHYVLPLGKARVRRRGEDLTLVTYGPMVPVSLQAAERVAGEGISVEVLDLRTIFPWDSQAVLASVERTGHLLVVHESPHSSGVGAEVASFVAERAAYSLEAPVRRLAGLDAPWPQFAIEQHALIDTDRVVAAARETRRG
ncbi:MAG: pyruvate dehydrogenase (acetyl-transferring) E1 component subunit alpha [Actinomycetota bacterium]|nr:pyruvate dehydrogenase (acetyl-transferring) E1 component subunit alpha [Actinomycetota bacterium]